MSKKKNVGVAVYYRISKRAKHGVRMQKRTCRSYCARNKFKIVKEYVDLGFSGTNKKRPALKELIEDLNRGKTKSLLVYKLDRLSRDFSQLNRLLDFFKEKDITLISATQNIDESTPEGRFMLRILMGLAEFEKGVISKRTIDGLLARKKER